MTTTRVALVTGAAQGESRSTEHTIGSLISHRRSLGIGYAIAIRLAQDGLNVAINDIPSKKDKIDKVVNEIRALGRESVAVPADVASEGEVKGMVDAAVVALGGLDVVRPASCVAGLLNRGVGLDDC